MPATVALYLIVMFVSFFACIFGIYYLKTRQNLAMIEKGMSPNQSVSRPAPYKNLKWALLLMGAGLGLFLAYLLDNFVFSMVNDRYDHDNNIPIYFALIAFGGGMGLLIAYKIEKKWWDEYNAKTNNQQ